MGATWVTVVPAALLLAGLVGAVRTRWLRDQRPGLALGQRLGIVLIAAPLFVLLIVGLRSLPSLFEARAVVPVSADALNAKALTHVSLYLLMPLAGLLFILGPRKALEAAKRALTGGKPGRRRLAASLAAGAGVSLGVIGAVTFLWATIPADQGGLFVAEGARVFFSQVTPATALFLAAAAAVAEETLFRGILLSHLRKSVRVHAAVLIQAGLFGLIHAGYGSIEHVLAAASFGAMMGYLVVHRGLLPAMIAHFLVNVVILSIWSGQLALLLPVAMTLGALLLAVAYLRLSVDLGDTGSPSRATPRRDQVA